MLVIGVLRWLLLAMEVCMAGPVLYLCVLSVSAIVTTQRRQAKSTERSAVAESTHFTFAIVVPAHNEESILATLLDSLVHLAYPKEQYTIHIVADNCTDNTANIARAREGVCVHERFDEVRRGKGYALNWLFRELESKGLIYDAYVILDADSVVVSSFLQSMAEELAQGAQAMQGCNSVLNVSDSPSTALRLLALTLINHVRPLGRNGLGASAALTGNGICLSRALLMRYPWEAYTIAEDYQYYLTLVAHGERVRYVPDALVRSEMPTTFAQMRTQDIRWESSGSQQKTWRLALRMLRSGLFSRDFVRIEAVAELLTPPLSFLVGICLLVLVSSVLLQFPAGLLGSVILNGGLLFYVCSAFYLWRPPAAVYRALLYVPRFIVWKLWVYFVLSKSEKYTREWIRTSRSISAK